MRVADPLLLELLTTSFPHLHDFTELDLSDSQFDSIQDLTWNCFCASLASLSSLRTLHLASIAFRDQNSQPRLTTLCSQLPLLSSLEDLTCSHWSSANLTILSPVLPLLKHLSSLNLLYSQYFPFLPESLSSLSSSLLSFYSSSVWTSDELLALLDALLTSSPDLQDLSIGIDECIVRPAVAQRIIDMLGRFDQLECLTFRRPMFLPRMLENLALAVPQLMFLELSYFHIPDSDVSRFLEILSYFESLCSLSLDIISFKEAVAS